MPTTVDGLLAARPPLDITRDVDVDPQFPYPVGSGAAGNVYKCIYDCRDSRTGQTLRRSVAVKVLMGDARNKQTIQKRLNRELATWHDLSHPNVTELLGIAFIIKDFPPGLVSPWVLRPDLLKYIGGHPELKRQKAKEIANGLQYLHGRGIVHGDLKVDNVMISNQDVAQLNDFGIAQILDVKGYTTMTERNVRFTAPELLMPIDGQPDPRPTFQSDIFSLGILLLQLFHGPDEIKQRGMPYNHIQYKGVGDFAIGTKICAGERPQRQRYNYMADQHWALITKCWDATPNNRPTIAQVCSAL